MPSGQGRGRPPKYPWESWFATLAAGGSVRLEAGIDFGVPAEQMRRAILAKARTQGVGVQTALQQRGRFIRIDAARRHRQYPWEQWLAGQQQELVPGRDFVVPVEIMRAQARRAAKQRGLGLRSKIFRGSLWIQALGHSNVLEYDPVG